jgi:hypothetical protein
MSVAGYTGDFDYSAYTPYDNTGYYDIFQSGYKNVRFGMQPNQQFQLDNSTAYNLPGIAYALYGDTSLWYALLAYNGLNDPLTDVYPGLVLQIPAKSDLSNYVTQVTNPQQATVTI